MLRGATIAWGVMGTLMALTLVQLTDSVLDIWWLLSGILGAAIIGLFLLGLMVPAIASRRAMAVAVSDRGYRLDALSQTDRWPESLQAYSSGLHPFLVIVIGPSVMIALGWMVANRRTLAGRSGQE